MAFNLPKVIFIIAITMNEITFFNYLHHLKHMLFKYLISISIINLTSNKTQNILLL